MTSVFGKLNRQLPAAADNTPVEHVAGAKRAVDRLAVDFDAATAPSEHERVRGTLERLRHASDVLTGVLTRAHETIANVVAFADLIGARPVVRSPGAMGSGRVSDSSAGGMVAGAAGGRDVGDAIRPAPLVVGFAEALPVRRSRSDPTHGALTTTSGVLIDWVRSGSHGQGRGGPKLVGRWRYEVAAVDHAEGHAAALMRIRGLGEATLYVNNRPCPYPRGCDRLLGHLLPPRARLTVYGPDGFVKVYTGTGVGMGL